MKYSNTANVVPEEVEMSIDCVREFCSLPPRSSLTKQRKCLTCEKMFLSEGPHNRRCTRCRGVQDVDDGIYAALQNTPPVKGIPTKQFNYNSVVYGKRFEDVSI